jgi:CLIP-associating protein 1/2
VTREACITIVSMAKADLDAFGTVANLLVPNLIKLVPNSARIMSSSALACLTILLRDVPYHKLIAHFTEQCKISKSGAVIK